jgi:hypothetical protein
MSDDIRTVSMLVGNLNIVEEGAEIFVRLNVYSKFSTIPTPAMRTRTPRHLCYIIQVYVSVTKHANWLSYII